MIKREDVERALAALTGNGMRADDPPEEWLVKVWDGDVLVDLIFSPKGLPIDDEVIARGEVMSVLSMEMRVMAIEDVLITKLMAITEHSLRSRGALDRTCAPRADRLGAGAVGDRFSPFARAFFVLLEGLEILPTRHEAAQAGARPEPRVRVITGGGSAAGGPG